MDIKISKFNVGSKETDCSDIIKWAVKWDWSVGEIVASRLTNKDFNDWETVVVLTVDLQYAGFCILEKKDDWGTDIDPALTPFITAVYVDPRFRGMHLSKKLLESVSDVARSLGFDVVYLISGEQGFYEKLGFEKYVQAVTLSGSKEFVYKKSI